jgi:hypothetical protein
MPAKILKARTEGDQFVVAIHLDSAKVLWDLEERIDAAGSPVQVRAGGPYPDPAWVIERVWGADVPQDQAIRETALLAADELLRRAPPAGPAHEKEGATLDLLALALEAPALIVAPPPAESSGDALPRS